MDRIRCKSLAESCREEQESKIASAEESRRSDNGCSERKNLESIAKSENEVENLKKQHLMELERISADRVKETAEYKKKLDDSANRILSELHNELAKLKDQHSSEIEFMESNLRSERHEQKPADGHGAEAEKNGASHKQNVAGIERKLGTESTALSHKKGVAENRQELVHLKARDSTEIERHAASQKQSVAAPHKLVSDSEAQTTRQWDGQVGRYGRVISCRK